MDLSGLNAASLDAWGELVTITTAEGVTRELSAIYEPAYKGDALAAGIPSRLDPSFSFVLSEYTEAGGQRGAIIRYASIDFTIISDPEIEPGDWCSVRVRAYG